MQFLEEPYDWKNLSLWGFLHEGNIPSSWTDFFISDDVQTDLYNISKELEEEIKNGVTIYPPIHKVFRAFISLDKAKVVILGMDPYHNGSAVGYCFSVLPGNRINPSLMNIYKELEQEGFHPNKNGVLTHWADQGCILLNTALTVAKGQADSHTHIWYDFSEKVIRHIGENTDHLVWFLMGSKALEFKKFIPSTHSVVVTSHPSPFSAYRGFLGSGAFRQINTFLEQSGKKVIKW